MKKLILILVVFTGQNYLAGGQILSPNVLPTSGGYFTGGGISLTWTTGETFNTTLQSGNIILTQGEQQPYIELRLLNLRVFLQGFYSGGGFMQNGFNGVNNVGCLNTSLVNLSPNPLDVDTVFVSLMNAITYSLVETAWGILKTDGSLIVKFNSPAASYYLRIRHRNTIETWSAAAIALASSTTYDFTNAASKAYGNNMTNIGALFGESPLYAMYSGDISDINLGAGYQDGVIESQDYTDMENAVSFILQGYVPEDITGDGVVESLDYTIMENNLSAVIFSMHP